MRTHTVDAFGGGKTATAIVMTLTLLVSVAFFWKAAPARAGTDWREDTCASKVVKDQFGGIQWVEHRGTGNDNVCYGTNHQDIFWSRGGNDSVRSFDGPDQIHLGGGHDKAYAGDGWDRIWTGGGEDIAYGGRGRDFFYERTLLEGPDWDCYIGGPGRDDGFIRDGDDLAFDDYWGSAGRDRYPQIDSSCNDVGDCVQDDVYQVEDGPCRHDPNADCRSPGRPRDVCQNMATRD